jgi:hypothetical protein
LHRDFVCHGIGGEGLFWLGKLELNLSGEERLKLSIGRFKRGVLLASVFGDCNVLESCAFHASHAILFLVVERSERSENVFQRSFIFGDGHGAGGDVVEKGKNLVVCKQCFRFHDLLCHMAREPQILFCFVFIFFIYGNYHAKIAEKISFVSLDKRIVLGKGKGLS